MANKTDVYFYEWSEKLPKYSKKMSYICMIKINRLKKILILYNLTVR